MDTGAFAIERTEVQGVDYGSTSAESTKKTLFAIVTALTI
jgi:hypothetical protein